MPKTEIGSTQQPTPELRFIPIYEVKVIAGGREALARYLSEQPMDLASFQAYVVVRHELDGFYVFGRARFGELAAAARPVLKEIAQRGPTEILLNQLAVVFNIHEWSRIDVVPPATQPSRIAVVYDRVLQFGSKYDVGGLRGVFLPSVEESDPLSLNASAPDATSLGGDTGSDVATPLSPRRQDQQQQQRQEQQSQEQFSPYPLRTYGDSEPPSRPWYDPRRWIPIAPASVPPPTTPGVPQRRSDPGVASTSEYRYDEGATSGTSKPGLEEVLQRTPHMDLSNEGVLTSGDALDVSIYVDTGAARTGEITEDIVIRSPATVHEFPVKVHLWTTDHFSILNEPSGTLVIKRDQPVSARLTFQVKVMGAHGTVAAGVIVAAFAYQGRPCGKVTRPVMIGPPAEAAPVGPTASPPASPAATSAKNEGNEGPRLALMPEARQPSMTITILDPDNTGRSFKVMVTTPLLAAYKSGMPGTWNLNSSSAELVRGFFGEFTSETLTDPQRRDALRGAGEELFNAAPKHFRDAFWQIIREGLKLESIFIVSEEPFVPWELMIPNRVVASGEDDVRPALGAQYAVGRWVCGDNIPPGQLMPLTDSQIIAPDYRGAVPKKLAMAETEAEFVRTKFNGRRISPATYAVMEAVMKGGGASLLHIICHGAAQTAVAQQIYFEDGEIISSSQLRGNAAFRMACRAKRPMIFLNACEVGRLQPSLVGVGGFARVFIDRGANAVVAPLWSVKDKFAHKIAVEFYEAILANPEVPFAEILRAIRAKAYAADEGVEDTYAAYCFYGDPLACRSRT